MVGVGLGVAVWVGSAGRVTVAVGKGMVGVAVSGRGDVGVSTGRVITIVTTPTDSGLGVQAANKKQPKMKSIYRFIATFLVTK